MTHTGKSLQQQIDGLRELIRYHEDLYHVRDQPEITDIKFDALMQELKRLEAEHPDLLTPDSPTQRVIDTPRENFLQGFLRKSARHSVPMMSLDNTYSEDDLRDFDRRVCESTGKKKIEYVAELKLDGMSMSVIYENGMLGRAATRGDGTIGENVTENARTIRSLPLSLAPAALAKTNLPHAYEVRGEVILETREFEAIERSTGARGTDPICQPAQRDCWFDSDARAEHP